MRNHPTRTAAAVARRNEETARLRFWAGVTVFIAGAAMGLTTLIGRLIGG